MSNLDALKIDRRGRAPAPRRGNLSWLFLGLAILALAGGAGWYFWLNGQVRVHVATAQANAGGGAGSSLDASGYVVARRQATISAKIIGKLAEANLEEGEHVDLGQVVARLDDSNYRAALNTAVAQVRQAQMALADAEPTYGRYQRLYAQGAISADTLQGQKTLNDAARLTLEVARAAQVQAEANENDTVVRAPFAGVVTDKAAQVGEVVAPSAAGGGFTRTGIATIVDMESLEVDVDVSEDYIDRVHPNQSATITLNAYPEWDIPATVIAVIPTADQSKGTVKVRVAIGQKDQRILPQMAARVSFLESAGAQGNVGHGVKIPAVAVQGAGDSASVFVVKDDGAIEKRPVTMGGKSGADVIVRGGLQPGEKVAMDAFDKLSEGSRAAVIP